MCEQCGEEKETKIYQVHDGEGTILSLCDECAEWLKEGQPDYDYVQISLITSKSTQTEKVGVQKYA